MFGMRTIVRYAGILERSCSASIVGRRRHRVAMRRFDSDQEQSLLSAGEGGFARGEGGHGEAVSTGPFAAALALAMGVGPMAIYALTALSPVITADLGLGRTAFGSLATVAFTVAAVCSIFGGRFIDRAGARTVLVMLFAGSGAALVLISVAPGYVWLLVAVALSGAAQSLSNPVTNRLIATRLLPGRQGVVMGVKQSGVQLMQFTAGATLPTAAFLVGWRTALGLTAIVAVVGLAFARSTVARAPGTPVLTKPGPGAGKLPSVVWWLAAYSFLVGAGLQATNVYMPLYAFEDLGLSATAAGATTALMGGVGLAARFGYGRIAERLQRPRGFLLALAALATVGTLVLMGPARSMPEFVWLGTAIHGLTALASNVVAMMAVITLVPGRQVGAATGVLAMGMYIGFALGPIVFGVVTDWTGQYLAGWTFVLVLYGLATALTSAWTRRHLATPGPSVPPPRASARQTTGEGAGQC